jgi:hypothetical protein
MVFMTCVCSGGTSPRYPQPVADIRTDIWGHQLPSVDPPRVSPPGLAWRMQEYHGTLITPRLEKQPLFQVPWWRWEDLRYRQLPRHKEEEWEGSSSCAGQEVLPFAVSPSFPNTAMYPLFSS